MPSYKHVPICAYVARALGGGPDWEVDTAYLKGKFTPQHWLGKIGPYTNLDGLLFTSPDGMKELFLNGTYHDTLGTICRDREHHEILVLIRPMIGHTAVGGVAPLDKKNLWVPNSEELNHPTFALHLVPISDGVFKGTAIVTAKNAFLAFYAGEDPAEDLCLQLP